MEYCGKFRRLTANSAINLGDTGLKPWNSKTVGETAFDVRADRTTTLVPRTGYTPDNCQRHTADENRRRRHTRPIISFRPQRRLKRCSPLLKIFRGGEERMMIFVFFLGIVYPLRVDLWEDGMEGRTFENFAYPQRLLQRVDANPYEAWTSLRLGIVSRGISSSYLPSSRFAC